MAFLSLLALRRLGQQGLDYPDPGSIASWHIRIRTWALLAWDFHTENVVLVSEHHEASPR